MRLKQLKSEILKAMRPINTDIPHLHVHWKPIHVFTLQWFKLSGRLIFIKSTPIDYVHQKQYIHR